MLTIILVFAGGIVFGYCVRARTRLLCWISRMSDVALYSLLFLLGLSMGLNEKLMADLPHIGRNALFLALGAVAMSLAVCVTLSRWYAGKK